jgi:hypothetical protein
VTPDGWHRSASGRWALFIGGEVVALIERDPAASRLRPAWRWTTCKLARWARESVPILVAQELADRSRALPGADIDGRSAQMRAIWAL